MTTSPPTDPVLVIRGDKIALGPLGRDLLPLYQSWMNNPRVVATLGQPVQPVTAEAEVQWFDKASTDQEHQISFTIYELSTLRPIGNTSLFQIDFRHRCAEYGIVIGEVDCWDRGFGTETTRIMLDYGFNALNLQNILLRVYDYNPRGVRAYTRAGFKKIGVRRQAHWLAGRAHDVILMDCIASEFGPSKLAELWFTTGTAPTELGEFGK